MNTVTGAKDSSRNHWSWLRGPLAGRGQRGMTRDSPVSRIDSGETLWRPFFPDLALWEAIVAAVLFVALVALALVTRPTLQQNANPNAVGYVPRPDWYFPGSFSCSSTSREAWSRWVPSWCLWAPSCSCWRCPSSTDGRRRPGGSTRRTRPIRIWPRIAGMVLVAFLVAMTVLAATAPPPSASAPSSTPVPTTSSAPSWP